jgi:hypothetical protein
LGNDGCHATTAPKQPKKLMHVHEYFAWHWACQSQALM